MVVMSFSRQPSIVHEPSEQFSSKPPRSPAMDFILDHNYFKSSGVESPSLSVPAATTTTTAQLVPTSATTTITPWRQEETEASTLMNESGVHDTDMFDELDALDFDLSDIDMENDTGVTQSFQEFVESTLNLPGSIPTCSEQEAMQQDNISFAHTTNTTNTSSPNSSPYSIPTKSCSCSGSESDASPTIVYSSSCQKCVTNLSASTVGSTTWEKNSQKRLKPGDYLPPLYIDTQNFGHPLYLSLPPSLSPQSSQNQHLPVKQMVGADGTDIKPVHVDQRQSVDATDDVIRWLNAHNDMTPPPMLETAFSSHNSTPLSTDEFGAIDQQTHFRFDNSPNHLHHQHQQHHSTDKNTHDVPSRDNGDHDIDGLDLDDLESLMDLGNYLKTASSHNPGSLTIPDPLSPLSSCCGSPCSQSNNTTSPKVFESTNTVKVEKADADIAQNFQKESKRGGLKLSILLDPLDYLGEEDVSSTFIQGVSQCSQRLSSAAPSPCWSTGSGYSSNLASPKPKQEPGNDLSILDLFASDSAHAFLSSDSDICAVHISQYT